MKKLVTSWGYEELDDLVGPITSGRLYVIGARPSNGKSTLMLNVLNAIYTEIRERSRKVLCYWCEQGREAAYTLWASLRLGLLEDEVMMERWENLPDEAEEAVTTLRGQLEWEEQPDDNGAFIKFSDSVSPSLKRLRAEVELCHPDIVFFDYIQKVRPAPGQDKFQAIAEMAGALQTMAVQQQCAVVVGSQLKRKGDQVFDKYRAPDLEDMRGAGEIEEAADVVTGLFRLLRPGMTKKEENGIRSGELALADFAVRNTMALRILKHRYRGSAADELIKLRIEGKRIYGRHTTRDEVPVLTDPPKGDAFEFDAETGEVAAGTPF